MTETIGKLAFLTIALSGCAGPQTAPPPGPGPAATAPAEPPPPAEPAPLAAPRCADAAADFPNDLDAPVMIDAASTTIGCTTRGDVDLFGVTVPDGAAGTALRFRLKGQRELAPKLEILDANRKRVHRQTGGKGEELVGWVHVAGGSRVLLQIDQTYGETETYTLVLEPVALSEAGEPNDDDTQATPLPEAGTAEGFLSQPVNGASLADWYRIDVTSNGALKLDLDMSPEIAVKAELRDGKRKRVAGKSGGRGERVQLEAKVKKGTYLLKLESTYTVSNAGKGDLPAWLTRPYVITTSR